MLYFFRVYYPTDDVDLYGCVDENGTFYWKASTLLKCIGYKKPSDVIRSHLSNIMSFDVLLSKHEPVTKPTYTSFPPQSKMITHAQFVLLCSNLSKSNHEFMVWYEKVWNYRLNCNNVYFPKSNLVHLNPKILPLFYVDEKSGQFYLKELPEIIFPSQLPQEEIPSEPSTSRENAAGNNLNEMEREEPSSQFMYAPLMQLNIGNIGPNGIPTQLFYQTRTRDVYVFKNEGRLTK